MFAIIGIMVVFGCIVAGYLMEHGNLKVLLQPAELIIIGGAAAGTVLISNPLHIIKKIAGGIVGVFGGSKFTKQTYIDALKTMYDLLNRARKDGLIVLEADVEDPEKSAVFSKNETFLKNHHIRDFVCDSLRMAITGFDAIELDQMLDLDMEVHHHDATQPTTALSTMADSLPGLGIVAAVLGVVITMQALGGPPEEIGQKVAAALVWHFSRHSALLRIGRTHRLEYDQSRRRGTCLPLRDARVDRVIPEGHSSHYGGGGSPSRSSRTCPAILQRNRASLSRWGRRCGDCGCWLLERAMDKSRPIIIVKKKGGHGGHHGGAWKVAYADFVTAMMALFIVLWLLNSSKQVQVAVGGYFKDPTGSSKKVGSNMQGGGENFVLTRDNMPKLKEQLQTAMRQMVDFEKLKSHIDMTVTAERLRIELSESASGTFFNSGSAKLNADGAELLITLAQELAALPNKLPIEGHTDSQPYAPSATYGNWELSADVANAARRVMQSHGIHPDQIIQVHGFADQRLRKPDAPLDPANRRISVIVQYIVNKDEEDKAPADNPSPGQNSAPAEPKPAAHE